MWYFRTADTAEYGDPDQNILLKCLANREARCQRGMVMRQNHFKKFFPGTQITTPTVDSGFSLLAVLRQA